jgi:hypothetical protein
MLTSPNLGADHVIRNLIPASEIQKSGYAE